VDNGIFRPPHVSGLRLSCFFLNSVLTMKIVKLFAFQKKLLFCHVKSFNLESLDKLLTVSMVE
jgi:hypothetical protein